MAVDCGRLTNQVFPVVAQLLDCAKEGVACTPLGVPDRACVMRGETDVWQECCEKGAMGAWPVRIYPVTGQSFPTQEATVSRCSTGLMALEVEIMVVRCAPSFDEDGESAAPCPVIESGEMQLSYDGWAMYDAVLCCLRAWANAQPVPRKGIINQLEYLGAPEGGCAGSKLTVTVELDCTVC